MTKLDLLKVLTEIDVAHHSGIIMRSALAEKDNVESEEEKKGMQIIYEKHAGILSNSLSNLIVLLGIDDLIKQSLVE